MLMIATIGVRFFSKVFAVCSPMANCLRVLLFLRLAMKTASLHEFARDFLSAPKSGEAIENPALHAKPNRPCFTDFVRPHGC